MLFISMLLVAAGALKATKLSLAVPIPDIGRTIVRDQDQDFRGGDGHEPLIQFGVPVDDQMAVDYEGRSLKLNCTDIQFGVAGEQALELSPSQTIVT
ncbi:hypothetical protein DAEQUDRAFT_727114 [Daedalea quercina L-15889]|uniref:Uncharacterized protein n=1 Tax=Daedalea quercina L-15889 TaxID=1314783 RepID=A0A165QA73_9APHY|nr:hypothetical protein DAEQUDRAFT_727114 [Daedalea quercina L-15889]